MGTMASQITNLTIVYSTVYSGEDQRKHQSSASLAFMLGIHRWLMNSPHKGPVTRNMFPFDDVIMLINAMKYVTESHLITRWSEISFHHHDNWGLKMVDILRTFSNPFSWTQMLAFKLYWICFLQSKCQVDIALLESLAFNRHRAIACTNEISVTIFAQLGCHFHSNAIGIIIVLPSLTFPTKRWYRTVDPGHKCADDIFKWNSNEIHAVKQNFLSGTNGTLLISDLTITLDTNIRSWNKQHNLPSPLYGRYLWYLLYR